MMWRRKDGVPRATDGRGFTLVEMIVVIGVIVFLTGLTFTVGMGVVEHGHRRATESTLTLLDQAAQEWALHADRGLTWWEEQYHGRILGLPRAHFDVHSDTPEEFIITQMLEVLRRTDAVRQILARIPPEFVYEYEAGTYPPWIGGNPGLQAAVDDFAGGITVLDGWGLPIYATHPGPPWSAEAAAGGEFLYPDQDGTIQTFNEQRYGVARHRRICFVSAGADRDFGWMNAPDASSKQYTATLDNVYSYAVDRPHDYSDYGDY